MMEFCTLEALHFQRQELPIVLGSHKFASDAGNDFLLSGFDSRFLNETWHGWSWPIVEHYDDSLNMFTRTGRGFQRVPRSRGRKYVCTCVQRPRAFLPVCTCNPAVRSVRACDPDSFPRMTRHLSLEVFPVDIPKKWVALPVCLRATFGLQLCI